MKNSIEEIWKEGFLNEKSLVAQKLMTCTTKNQRPG
jgi:hypothetical protein